MKKLIAISLLFIIPSISFAEDLIKRENVEELLVLMNVDSIIDNLYSQIYQMTQDMAQQLGVKLSERDLFDTYAVIMVSLMKSEMNWEKMKGPMTDLYLKHYSDKENQDMLAFYKSESGRSMIKKMPAVMKDSVLISQNIMKDFIPKMQALSDELKHEIELSRNKKQ
jgi:hypothetical protein